MKKLIVVLGAVAIAMGVQAASVDWKVAGTAATNGYNVYLLTDLASSYESAAALASAAVGSGTIAKVGRDYGATGTAASDAITTDSMKNAYWVIVAPGDNVTSYNYVKADMSAMVYDPDKQESSPGAFSSVTAANMLAGTSANFQTQTVPEPTSGLLIVLGMAGLALRRRRA